MFLVQICYHELENLTVQSAKVMISLPDPRHQFFYMGNKEALSAKTTSGIGNFTNITFLSVQLQRRGFTHRLQDADEKARGLKSTF